jgi:ribosome-associated protein
VRDLVVQPGLTIPGTELTFTFARSGGSGGQNVNKVSSKVDLRWHPASSSALHPDDRAWLLAKLASRLTNDGDLIVTSTLTRDQVKNREDALTKLALIVRAALIRPKRRRETKPSRAAKRRRVDDKRHRSETKRNRRGDD